MPGTKEIRIVVSEGQHERLTKAKGDRTWREVLYDGTDLRENPDTNDD